MNKILILYTYLFFLLNTTHLTSQIHHTALNEKLDWQEENLTPFNELLLSWNGTRPQDGKLQFHIRVKIEDWSPWLLYASWECNGQSSFESKTPNGDVAIFQDTLDVLKGKKATSFQVKIVEEGNFPKGLIHTLHVYTNGDKLVDLTSSYDFPSSISLPVAGLSQRALNHERNKDLCSPTSTTAVTRYLSHNLAIDPLRFAEGVWDRGYDIYGNWVLNVAEASSFLGPDWNCWVERLHNFSAIYERLEKGTPVIVSVRGPLKGSASEYAKGHLLVVIGFDILSQKVLCMDPAFLTDSETLVSYDLEDFIEAWARRGNIAYLFERK